MCVGVYCECLYAWRKEWWREGVAAAAAAAVVVVVVVAVVVVVVCMSRVLPISRPRC
jgi:hypothetical protein